MSDSELLKGQTRSRVGSHESRKLRRAGRIPATLQTHGGELRVDFSIDEAEFLTSRRHHTHLYDIEVGDLRESAVVHELQWDVFGERLMHIEFQRVSRFEKISSEVPLVVVGHPKAGLVNQQTHAVDVLSLPTDIPDQIELSVEGLEIGAELHASELKLPEGVELDIPPTTLILTIVEPTKEREPEAEAEEGLPEAGTVPAAEAEEGDSEKDED
jgi:large subunit ribosomal protein L25